MEHYFTKFSQEETTKDFFYRENVIIMKIVMVVITLQRTWIFQRMRFYLTG